MQRRHQFINSHINRPSNRSDKHKTRPSNPAAFPALKIAQMNPANSGAFRDPCNRQFLACSDLADSLADGHCGNVPPIGFP